MYHCHLRFYLIGNCPDILTVLQETALPEHFSRTVTQSSEPKAELLAAADLILADLTAIDGQKTISALTVGKKKDADLILRRLRHRRYLRRIFLTSGLCL